MARARSNRKVGRPKASAKEPPAGKVPDVYKDMLADVFSSPTQSGEEGRAVKKRRVGGRLISQRQDEIPSKSPLHSDKSTTHAKLDDLFTEPNHAPQSVIQSESEDSADSDVNWEEVDLQGEGATKEVTEPDDGDTESLQINLGADQHADARAKASKRKPMTALEKKLRLEIHKMHLCAFIAHVYLRNHWCNDAAVHSILSRFLPKKTISYLNPDDSLSQFQRSRSFVDGLDQAIESFRTRFKVTARGMRNSRWAEDADTLAKMQPPEDIDLPMQKDDFRAATISFRASRDVGAQIFCALLRSTAPKFVIPQKKYAATIVAEQRSRSTSPEVNSDIDPIDQKMNPVGGGPMPSIRERSHFETCDQAILEASPSRPDLHPGRLVQRPLRESKYPVYWVEAFNEAVSKWIPIDPFVPQRTSKPSKFEPPIGERENNMSYVVAFEDDGSARDVTRRYAKAYNAKTRRERVEMTKGGERWWKRVMMMYRPRAPIDRDQIEDAELAAKEAAEPIPRNVQDFKDHPYYALERHLRRHEAIYPRREVGKIGAGRGNTTTGTPLEPIFRRRDVHNVQSGDKWYRMGRELKPAEQPLKRVPTRRARDASAEPEDQDCNGDSAGTGLYAIHQTTVYTAPLVVNGLIPKNVYGNLDIYVPSMIPPGACHIQHPDTARAAKILGIDYADAVTGFVFKGRRGTAVVNGAVVAIDYREAVQEVIKALADERVQAEEERRSIEAMRMWKRFFAGLRVRQRIEGYEVEGERDGTQKGTDESQDHGEDEGGGFFPDQGSERISEPTIGRPYQASSEKVEDMSDAPPNTEGIEQDHQRSGRFLDSFDDDAGGGFMIDDDDDAEDAVREALYLQPRRSRSLSVIDQFRTNEPNSIAEEPPASESRQVFIEEPELGGGFVLEEDGQDETFKVVTESHDREMEPHFTSQQIAESRQLQEIYDNGEMKEMPLQKATASAGKLSSPASKSDTSQSRNPALGTPVGDSPDPQSEYAVPDLPADSAQAQSSEDDKGSLVSEDPEDEDAEPEWLA